ncbi:haloacid dehalogenase-like hydrolase [Streptomyces sp. TRM66268-LWL]|uniref:Haloacid dehalogenase-like hydrolase n=1 Tax=Streptomyces polyasparticus TaxID=2767826 RepID=A0ABR7SR61_9ACTN|nr:HAD hydrolase-like protein [Streptomyces polyasparticus]MBC9717997.1 haloacid dehalogenase-like hydrolase [Streptomyces polyasparticus]
MPLIVLWDIDHTLIDNAGVSKEIYAAAFERVAGRAAVYPARTEGRTDRLILAGMFRDHGLDTPAWPDLLPALEAAGKGRETELARRGRVLPGVRDALVAVAAAPDVVSSVLTGNIRANARVKLAPFGLDVLLDLECGAYGADADDRAALVDVARERMNTRHGLARNVPVVLIGDTPRDVEAALNSGAHIIAVASGIHEEGELRAAGATLVLPDLRNTPALLEHLRTLAGPAE